MTTKIKITQNNLLYSVGAGEKGKCSIFEKYSFPSKSKICMECLLNT